MNITVVGPGRWGSFLAWYLDSLGHKITLYGREGADYSALLSTRTNGIVTLNEGVLLTSDLSEALSFGDTVVISINAQNLRDFFSNVPKALLEGKTFILCMKGLERKSGKRLTQVAGEFLPDSSSIAVWVGPGHPQEFIRGIPNCMVIDSEDPDVKARLVDAFSGGLIRFYYGSDLIGSEVGAATKNVVGIAAGFLDGLGISSLKGALMSRGTREIARLICAMGGNELSAYGLSHLGDYEATVFSKYSHNRAFGEALIKGERFTKLAEGYYTVEALMKLSRDYGVELPISAAVYDVTHKGADPRETLSSLFIRSLKQEF